MSEQEESVQSSWERVLAVNLQDKPVKEEVRILPRSLIILD